MEPTLEGDMDRGEGGDDDCQHSAAKELVLTDDVVGREGFVMVSADLKGGDWEERAGSLLPVVVNLPS